jgi:glutamyl-tRNA synthetase
MGITDVLRGDDLLASTPRQLQLYRALGVPPPRFAHVGLVLGPDGEKLSKREGPVSVSALLERGVDPARIRRGLLELSGVGEAPGDFALEKLRRGAVRLPAEAFD